MEMLYKTNLAVCSSHVDMHTFYQHITFSTQMSKEMKGQ